MLHHLQFSHRILSDALISHREHTCTFLKPTYISERSSNSPNQAELPPIMTQVTKVFFNDFMGDGEQGWFSGESTRLPPM